MSILELYKIFQQNPKICTDSRVAEPHSIFFALKGENFNGNKFAAEALEKCAFAVVDDPEIVLSERYLLVDDVLQTLQELAKTHRQQLSMPVIAITGSNGKTTTKELIANVLKKAYRVYSTKGNYNNHIGVPLSLLELSSEYEIAVIEMGANKPGDIRELCEIAQPTHGIITNVGKAHLEGFGTFEKIMKTKGELYDYLYVNDGIAFVNYDNEYLEDMNPPRKTIHYGVSKFTHCQGQLISDSPFVSFRWISTGEMVYDETDLDWSDKDRYVELNLVGSYNFENGLAATCVGSYFNVSERKIKAALESYKPDNNRSQYLKTENNVLIVDSYNANPTSMKLAIEDFVKFDANSKILVLGDMFELGKVSSREHDVLIHFIEELNTFEDVYYVGNEFYQLKNDSTRNWFKDVKALAAELKKNKLRNKTILLKGSRGMEMERLIPEL